MIFQFHHTLQKKRRRGWEWRKRGCGRVEKAGGGSGVGVGREGKRENKIKPIGRRISLPSGWWAGRAAWGRGLGSSVHRGCPQPPHTHPRYVQYKPQIITTAK